MRAGPTTVCRSVLSQKPGGMVWEGLAILTAALACLERWEGAKLEGFGRLDDDD